jgi:hypothetical protein
LTRIVATWPDGETLVWTDGELSAGPHGKNPKQIAFLQVAGDEYPTNPYAFLRGVKTMTSVLRYPEAKIEVTEGELPDRGEGCIIMPPIDELQSGPPACS